MKSIRLSLIVYFLILLTTALGSVCWLVYRTAAAALDERRKDSQNLVEAQYETHCNEARAALDRRLVRQAQTMATMARSMSVHLEALYPLGMMGTPFAHQGYLNIPLWLAEGAYPPLSVRLFRMHSTEIDIEAAEDLLPAQPSEDAHEFFAVFNAKGQLIKRSRLLSGSALGLNPELLHGAEPLHEYFDEVELGPGHTVRRVTLKTSVTRFHSSSFPPWLWRYAPGRGRHAKAAPPPPPQPPPQPPPRPFVVETETPVIFIEYAIDLSPLEARLRALRADHDRQIAQLDADADGQLLSLRRRLFWIAILTFAGTVAGGFILLRRGLAPLARLSEAVSAVSERDFRLHVGPGRLPVELQPIADRLVQTLAQLGKAFDREKHAAADISHELRTPLAALLTNLDVALRKPRRPDEYQEILEECRASGHQMQMLVERLLTLARLDAGADRARPRAVDAGELAQQCADVIRPLARARDLALTVRAASLMVETDPDKLREVLTNLLHNAVEYNRLGGSIELTVERVEGELCLAIRDTGVGITLADQARIFERFYRADPSRHADSPHAGLGLAIVKSYVDLLGGTIAVDSTPNQGTTFYVRLPMREPTSAPARVPA